MSRPSATQSPCSTIACCLRTSAARTPGSAATFEAPAETSGVRIASVTSSPSSSTRSPTSMRDRSAISPAAPRRARGRRAPTARYIAPVSRYVKPSRSATARATVDLPAPAGPSMAMTMASEARRGVARPRGSVDFAVRWLARSSLVAVLVAAAPAEAKVACGDGDDRVRGRQRCGSSGSTTGRRDESGFEEYACLGRRRSRCSVGGVGSDQRRRLGRARRSTRTPARFLASYHQSDGEGGPSAHVRSSTSIAGAPSRFVNLACCEWMPLAPARDATARVAVLAPGEGVFVKPPGRRARTLAGEDAARATSRCTAAPSTGPRAATARSATLRGVTGGEATALEPVRLRRRGGACAAARGRTIVASGSVRVVRDGRRALRLPGRQPRPFAARRRPRRRGSSATAGCSCSARAAPAWSTRCTRRAPVPRAESVSAATLLRDGTLAWIDFAGAADRAQRRARSPSCSRVGAAGARGRAPRARLLDRDGGPQALPARPSAG